MSEQEHPQPGVLPARQLVYLGDVVEEVVEACDPAAAAARAAVSEMIVGVDRQATLGEKAAYVLIALAVLAQAVHEHDDRSRTARGEPRAIETSFAGRAFELARRASHARPIRQHLVRVESRASLCLSKFASERGFTPSGA